jgi:hypothetical protein
MPPPTKSLRKEESVDFFDDSIDWSQVSETQFDTQLDTQIQSQSQTQVETQTTIIGKPSLAKLAHSSASPPVRTISLESGSSVQTNDSTKTLVVDDEDVDYRALLEGAENINWDDWGSDEENNVTASPRKLKSPSKSKKFTPVKSKNLKGVVGGGGALAITPPPYTIPCTRCVVVNITRYDYLDDPVQVSGFSCPLSLFSSSRTEFCWHQAESCHLMPGSIFPIFCDVATQEFWGWLPPGIFFSYRVALFSQLWLMQIPRKSW